MSVSDIFLLPDGRLRAGWRVALFVVVFILSLLVVSLLVSFTSQVPGLVLQLVIILVATCLATWLMVRWQESAPFMSVGLAWKPGAAAELTSGMGVGVGAVWAVTAIELAIGAIRFENRRVGEGSSTFDVALTATLTLAGVFVIGAVMEEVLFRGYVFQRIAEGSNGVVAVLLTSLVFGWVHSSNPYATDLSMFNTTLAGALFGIAVLRTGALWWPIGFHFAWNWMLAVVGHPVSGLDVAQLPWEIVSASEPVWVHGGSYGPEGGLVASGILTACSAGVLRLLRTRKHDLGSD